MGRLEGCDVGNRVGVDDVGATGSRVVQIVIKIRSD